MARTGAIDLDGLDFLDGSNEVARFWSEPEGEQTFIIDPEALGADPFLFGMAMVDAIRHAAIAARYCVVAMAGDQLGDFSDLFNVRTLSVPDRRRAAASGRFASLWGNGWFMLANPVYGPSIRGNFDEVFPADKRWSDPQGGNQ